MNKFVFRPVGQGLFYTGSLLNYNYNFVYDCGTENCQKIINQEILKYKKEVVKYASKPLLDFVVISHLHNDHYSGLFELIKNFKVKKIYLPYLNFYTSDVLRLYLFYDLFVDNNRDENQFDYSMTLYRLLESLYGLSNDNLYREYFGDFEYIESAKIVECQYGDKSYWEFKFLYNKAKESKINEINNNCKILLNNAKCTSMEEFIKQNEKNIDVIAAAYKHIFGKGNSLNNTSIILLHYPTEERKYLKYCNYDNYEYGKPHYCICEKCKYNDLFMCAHLRSSYGITLLTGDVLINKATAEELKQCVAYKDLTIMQVPHHGSLANWNAVCKYSIVSDIYIIPFGYGNHYGHPHVRVIDDLMSKLNEFYCVTQKQGYIYCIS